MNIWRLMAHHLPDTYDNVIRWSRSNDVIAIGWGQTGDLREHSLLDERAVVELVAQTHNGSRSSYANGGRSLWNLYRGIQTGDLVIVNANGPKLTMQVTSDYYYKAGEFPPYYEHRRTAKAVPIDPIWLWQRSGKIAVGQGVFPTLVRCANAINEAELEGLTK